MKLQEKTFQPTTLDFYPLCQVEMICPICGEKIESGKLPTFCGMCHSRFEWTVKVLYKEEKEE